MTLPTFRPRTSTELVDAAVQLGRRHYLSLLTLSAAIAIPSLILGLVAQWMLPQQTITTELQLTNVGLVPALLLNMCWFWIGLGALVASAGTAYVDGRTLEPGAALRLALRRAPALVGGNLIALVFVVLAMFLGAMLFAVIAGFVGAAVALLRGGAEMLTGAIAVVLTGAVMIAMVVAVLLASAYFVNVTAAAVIEQLGPWSSVRRSMRLVRGGLLRVTGVVAVMLALYFAAYLSLWGLMQIVVRDATLSGNIASVLVVTLYPFLSTMLALLYYDLRIRREGYDIELMARALGEAGGDAPAAGEQDEPANGTVSPLSGRSAHA